MPVIVARSDDTYCGLVATDPRSPQPLDVDVLVVGAGLSGIGTACRIATECPDLAWAVLEARESTGGTWDLFRYPGVRSDSDMFTLSYPFRPWTGEASIAAGEDILDYVRATAREYGVDERIHLGQRVETLSWDSAAAVWTVRAVRADGSVLEHRARFVHLATGYYSYDRPHDARIPGVGDFAGDLVHPQHWPEGLDVAGRRVVVVGSGATAVTLVPALVAEGAAHVTMLQRSPTYVAERPSVDHLARRLSRTLPASAAYRAVRAKNVVASIATYGAMRRWPERGRALLQRRLVDRLPEGYPVQTHFGPDYDPWDQRLCLTPDGDLLDALSSQQAEVVTSTIDRVVPEGVRLADGSVLPADVLVTATGLAVEVAGGARIEVDGRALDPAEHVVYRGCMLSDVPNLSLTWGYANASWTLRSDLTARWLTGLLRRMRTRGLRTATPRWDGSGGPLSPLMPLSSGYLRRAEHLMPRQGGEWPWRVRQSYLRDSLEVRRRADDDGVLELR